MKLHCAHADTCLPDYWRGDARAHVCVPASRSMTFKDVRDAIHSEISQGAIAGNDDRTRDDSGDIGDRWYKAAHAAVNRDVRPARKGARLAFPDLEPDSEDGEMVMAYFVFIDA